MTRRSAGSGSAAIRRRVARGRSRWRALRPVGLGLCFCLALVIMFASFQRSLIYFPRRVDRIDPVESGLPVGQVHSVTLRTGDGLALHGWHILPDGQRATDPSECDDRLQSSDFVALYFSGNGGNRTYRGTEVRLLTGVGAHVFLFDYRGYGENTGSPSEEGLAEDARSVWRYVTAERSVDSRRILLYGESIGGAVAVRLAAEKCQAGSPPAGLILRSTFSSLPDVGAYHYPWLPVRWLLTDRYESVERITDVTCPILQIHGRPDTIVPIRFARRLFETAPAVSAGGLPKRFVELRDANHNDVVDVAGPEVQQAIRDFLQAISAWTRSSGR